MHDGKLHASEREVKRLLQGRQRAMTDAEIPELEGAVAIIEKLTRRVKKVEGELKMREAQWNEMWEWYKRTGGGK